MWHEPLYNVGLELWEYTLQFHEKQLTCLNILFAYYSCLNFQCTNRLKKQTRCYGRKDEILQFSNIALRWIQWIGGSSEEFIVVLGNLYCLKTSLLSPPTQYLRWLLIFVWLRDDTCKYKLILLTTLSLRG